MLDWAAVHKSGNNLAKLKSVLKPVLWALPHRPVRSLRGQYACSQYARELLLGSFNNLMFEIFVSLRYNKFILSFRTCEPTPLDCFMSHDIVIL